MLNCCLVFFQRVYKLNMLFNWLFEKKHTSLSALQLSLFYTLWKRLHENVSLKYDEIILTSHRLNYKITPFCVSTSTKAACIFVPKINQKIGDFFPFVERQRFCRFCLKKIDSSLLITHLLLRKSECPLLTVDRTIHHVFLYLILLFDVKAILSRLTMGASNAMETQNDIK